MVSSDTPSEMAWKTLMSKLQLALIDVAQGEVGVLEEGGNNQGVQILNYMRATWMPEEANKKGWPWCAAFVCWCLTQACKRVELDPAEIIYLGADAYGWETHAEKKGFEILPEKSLTLPGDIVTFDFSHIGIVIEDRRSTIETVEGNTNGKGERDSESGDGVWRKSRARGLVKSFIRLPGAYENE